MNHRNGIRIFAISTASIAAVLLLLFAYFSPDAEEQIKHLKNYGFSHKNSLEKRIKPAPNMVLKAWKKIDQKDGYKSYTPNNEEMLSVKNALDFLPEPVQELLRQRLIGLYFISGFISSGATDWVTDEKGNIFTYMIINPDTLRLSISDLLTLKENTCFKQDGKTEVQIALDLQTHKGITYILLHEAAHAVDYVCNVTPFTEHSIQRFMDLIPESTPFTAGIWKNYNDPVSDFTFRKRISFYGINANEKDKINISYAKEMYRELNLSPFISLYGSLNWAEDLSELFAFYHLTEKNGDSYIITVYENGRPVYSAKPAKNPKTVNRFKHLEVFYQPLVLPKRK